MTLALLVCHDCDRFFTSPGGVSEKRVRDCNPVELFAHLHDHDDLFRAALGAGWQATDRGGCERWSCPECVSRGAPKH